ncbi:MAG: hypothetical protein FWF75_10255 [Propionibacteriaceae bacterium]|nr:hypothetical protein [Propionibacteriaceae bacterium]
MGDGRADGFRPPAQPEPARPAPPEPSWREADAAAAHVWQGAPTPPTPPTPPVPEPDTRDDAVASRDQSATVRRLRTALIAVSVVLALMVALTIMRLVELPALNARIQEIQNSRPTVTATVPVPRDAPGVSGTILTGYTFGTVPLPSDLLARGYVSSNSADWASLSSKGTVVIVGLQTVKAARAVGGGDAGASAQGCAVANGATLDAGSQSWKKTPMGYTGWCVTGHAPSGLDDVGVGTNSTGRGCFYATAHGASYIWVWSPADAPDPLTQTLLDSYVPG